MIVACVRTGDKYPVEYVYKLRAMVARHLPINLAFVCLTDRPQDLSGIDVEDISSLGLPGWWGKMALFSRSWRGNEPVLYFDLDTVPCGDLARLANLGIGFGICKNFTRAAGVETYPCRYGSCVMYLGTELDGGVWQSFLNDKDRFMASKYGDQAAIEELLPDAKLLQDLFPEGYFLGYRDLTAEKPAAASVVVFAGRSKPHNCEHEWVRREWEL